MRPDADPQSVRLFYLLKKLNKCHREHDLLADGDRIVVALSGGKDSCTLLDALHQRRGIERYTLIAIHVLPAADMACGATADEAALRTWLENLGIAYRFVRAEEAGFPPPPPPCPVAADSKRTLMRQIIRLVEEDHPRAKVYLRRAVERCRAATKEMT
jgi:tRNA(Ile)-lysidine synthase TilS/MesJ